MNRNEQHGRSGPVSDGQKQPQGAPQPMPLTHHANDQEELKTGTAKPVEISREDAENNLPPDPDPDDPVSP